MGNKINYIEVKDETLFLRGRLRNESKIVLPANLKEEIIPSSISVCLTPIGSHQNLIVKRIGDFEIEIQSNGGLPIDCFYHVFAKKLINEEN